MFFLSRIIKFFLILLLLGLWILLPLALLPRTSFSGEGDAFQTPLPSPSEDTASPAVSAEPVSALPYRAVWISYLEWQHANFSSEAAFTSQVSGWMQECADLGLNVAIVQVRPFGDALYPSELFPFSHLCTGTQGQDPGFDPLAILIEQAHSQGLEVEAWINPYRIQSSAVPSELADNSVAELHPDWVKTANSGLWLDPANEDVQAYIADGIRELCRNYNVDGIHFDDYFYPYKIRGKEFPDDRSFRKYPRGYTAQQKDDWRRNNVNMVIEELQHTIKSIKPWVEFGISPFGVWRNQSSDPRGSATQAGAQNYDDLYADILKWLEEGSIDYVAPQLYWEIGKKVADYEVLAKWWSENSYGKNLYIGLYASQLVNPKAPIAYRTPNELTRQMRLNERHPEIDGCAFYSTQAIMKNPQGLCDSLQQTFYRYPALTPINRNIEGDEPACPQNVRIVGNRDEALLLWNMENEEGGCAVAYYVVYAFEGDNIGDLNNPANIICKTTARGVNLSNIPSLKNGSHTLVVTAVNKFKRESCPSEIVHY